MNNKKLTRSRTDTMIGGVCAGLGQYFNIDPTIVRLLFVLLLITGSAGFWIYLVMWIIVPLENEPGVVDATLREADHPEHKPVE